MRYCLSVDLGSEQDYTAISLIKRVEKIQDNNIPSYNSRPIHDEPVMVISELHLVRMDKIPLKVPYPKIVQGIKHIMDNPDYVGNITLVVDRTGIGIPVIQMMYQLGMAPIGISIHGGDRVTSGSDHYGVPKRDIVTALLTAMQTHRLKIPPPSKMPIIKEFKEQLQGFIMKINKNTGHDSYEAMLERIHDDLVISCALGVYWMDKTHGITSTLDQVRGRK